MPSRQITDLKYRLQSKDIDELFDVLVDIGKGSYVQLKDEGSIYGAEKKAGPRVLNRPGL
ncbi:MAG: hypothetical protein JXR70_09335 [Spirochaetales bacterium]|nr:hypothetical protein [Spirochaetales bacterium]